eukprot:5366911-Prymnesium_polylepis.1
MNPKFTACSRCPSYRPFPVTYSQAASKFSALPSYRSLVDGESFRPSACGPCYVMLKCSSRAFKG